MTPEEKFIFDLDGYLVVKNVLDQEQCKDLSDQADRAWPGDYDEKGMRRTSKVSHWGADFLNLVDHPKLLPYLNELLGPKFRLDHDYCIFMQQGADRGRLHGGSTPQIHAADHWYRYHDGVMRNGLTVFTYSLGPAAAGDGGFACIPGSHKSNFVNSIPDEVRAYQRPAHYVRQPEVEAGDVVIFTEALVHGTMPWTAPYERRALLFKYSPGHSAWSQNYYNLEEYPQASQQQRRIMAPPSVGSRPDSIEAA
ncbi:MAG: hypothetical protein GKR89_05925 [Candidatus Latescibacteria bacterium]|nr:hypothetical protein [Candidatus Latescibacterota bacterium]